MKGKYQIATIFISLSLLGLIACSGEEEPRAEKNVTPVKVAHVIKEDFSIPVHTSGLLKPAKEIKLSFKTPGVIEKFFVREGQFVKKGELIAKLDLSEIKAQVMQASEGFEKARRDYERVNKLYQDSVVTLEQFQNVETAMNVAESALEIARYNEELSVITAPNDGKVLRRFAENRELVNAGTPIILFGVNGAGWVVHLGVTDRDIVKLNLEDRAHVYIDAYSGRKFNAVVSEIGAAANPVNGTFEVELLMDPNNEKLASGFVAKVEIYPSATASYFTIPVEAIYEADGSDATVFIIDKNKNLAVKRIVSIEKIFSDKVAVTSGVDSNDFVITSGVEYLKSGAPVEIIN